jgi:hypothetical protein
MRCHLKSLFHPAKIPDYVRIPDFIIVNRNAILYNLKKAALVKRQPLLLSVNND